MYIGDPKQSIYGFRGADLFTYLEAKSAVLRAAPPQIYTLLTNFRSSKPMVEAVNALFAKTPGVFLQAASSLWTRVPMAPRRLRRR
jgi:exodeoxyribonuclease V beta subunit